MGEHRPVKNSPIESGAISTRSIRDSGLHISQCRPGIDGKRARGVVRLEFDGTWKLLCDVRAVHAIPMEHRYRYRALRRAKMIVLIKIVVFSFTIMYIPWFRSLTRK